MSCITILGLCALAAPLPQDDPAEYLVRRFDEPLCGVAAGWQAPNPRHGFRTLFTDHGLRVVPGSGSGGNWLFTVCLVELGRGDATCAVGPGEVVVRDATVEYRYGSWSEWYRNDEAGLEQGFTLGESPGGDRSEPVTLHLAWAGGLEAVAFERGASFHTRGGEVVFEYRDLIAFDALGRELETSMQVEGHALRLVIDDRDAVYPITVDPLLASQVDKLLASDADDFDLFGGSVAISGDFMVVGAVGQDPVCCDAGAAYVFERVAGVWSEHTKLVASDAADGDAFGVVDIDGDRIVVGAKGDESDRGAAYVFAYDGTSWTEEAKLVASDGTAGDQFGDVAIDGTTIVVGAKGDGSNRGGAYAFVYDGTSWSQQQKLTAADGVAGDLFGSVDVWGDVAVVGAWGDASERGSAYVFNRSGTVWTFGQKLQASDAAVEDRFGESVAIWDDRIVIGACSEDGPSAPGDAGAAYVFMRNAGVWSEDVKLQASDSAPLDLFGFSVAVDRDRVLVGAPDRDDMTIGRDAGAVYVFERFGKVWSEQTIVTGTGAAPGDLFGVAVDIDCQDAAIGAFFDDDPTAGTLAGSAYVFEVTPVNLTTFCFGDGGVDIDMDLSPDCTPCPCGNNAALTTGGCLNSNGGSAVLYATGVPSATPGNDTLRFEMLDASPSTFGVLTSGDNQLPANAANPCFGLGSGVLAIQLDGLRCVGANVIRHGTRPTDGSGDVGLTTNGWGPPSGPVGGLVAQGGFVCGQTRHFQVIYRDFDTLVCLTGQNTSNGVSVTVVP